MAVATREANTLLSVPAAAGRAIVEAGAAIACPLQGTDNFVRFCNERGLSIDRDRLLRLERLGLFAPVFRVCEPSEDVPPLSIPPAADNNGFDQGWAWDTTGVKAGKYEVPSSSDRTQEGYYSIFQIDHLGVVLSMMTVTVPWDSYLEAASAEIDWRKNGQRWLEIMQTHAESLRTHGYLRAVALLCQYISNRYYPQTQGDQRTISIPSSPHASDRWTVLSARDWDWYEQVRAWNPRDTEALFELTPAKLRHAYNGLAVTQAQCDPLERWYELVQFVRLQERQRLKGSALRAETLRAGAQMLRLLHTDLYGEKLPPPNEVACTILTPMPERETRKDTRRYLEFVVNRYGLNPQPTVCLILEGPSEEIVVTGIFEEYFGAHPGKYGIELLILGGVDFATGGKADRFRAILRLIDYLHHHQTITFLILDNEGYARRLETEAQKAKSIHHTARHITHPDNIRIWQSAFEFDNFSSAEIATALTAQAGSRVKFSPTEVGTCKQQTNPGKALEELYRNKAARGLDKLKLNQALVQRLLSGKSGCKIEERPIIQILQRVAELAARNPFPIMQKLWERNQASGYLGKRRR